MKGRKTEIQTKPKCFCVQASEHGRKYFFCTENVQNVTPNGTPTEAKYPMEVCFVGKLGGHTLAIYHH